LSLYNADGQINTTQVAGNAITGSRAPDGSYNIVINASGSYQGLHHPCGAYNAVVVTDPSSNYYAANGSMNVIANNFGGYSPMSPSGNRFGGVPWTPLNLGSKLAEWWDGTDSSTMNLTSNVINTITGKKAGIVLTGNGSPTFNATARNGKGGIVLNGSAQFLTSGASPGLPVGVSAWGAAIQAFSNSSAFHIALAWGATDGDNFLREMGQEPAYIFNTGAAPSGTSWNGVDKFVYGAADGVSSLMQFENGGDVPFIATYTPSTSDPTREVCLGARSGGTHTASWNGVIQMAFVFNGTLTSVERHKLEGYISWHVGLNGSNLPASHPYKNLQPTTAGGSGSFLSGVPTDVAASGIIAARTFFDDFNSISTIDTTDTGAAGFNWYTHRAWPNAAGPLFGNWIGVTSQGATPAGNISVGSSLLTLSDYPGGSTGLVIQSAVRKVGGGYIGTTFGGGAYFEISMAFNPALSLTADPSWPAIWLTAIEFFTGSATRFAEPDIFEGFPSGNGSTTAVMALHDWDNVGVVNYKQEFDNVVGSPTFTTQHRYGMWWIPASKNGGIGIIRRYFDGTFVGQTSYSTTAGGNPVFDNGNPNGVMSVIDGQNLVLNLSCGPSWPAIFDYASVYQ